MYKPDSDSFFMIDTIKELDLKGKSALEIGCGSGVIAEELATRFRKVLAVDIDPKSVEFTRKKGINAKVSDLFSKVQKKFDLIVFNPPYLPCYYEEDKENCCGDGRIIKRFVKEAPGFLERSGTILFLTSSLTPYRPKWKVVAEKKLHFETLFIHKLTLDL